MAQLIAGNDPAILWEFPQGQPQIFYEMQLAKMHGDMDEIFESGNYDINYKIKWLALLAQYEHQVEQLHNAVVATWPENRHCFCQGNPGACCCSCCRPIQADGWGGQACCEKCPCIRGPIIF